jgi:toxin ParE1/3/4
LPGFILTRRAARDLRDIHERSVTNWGEARADRYLDDIYSAFGKVVANPGLGRLRASRSSPFLMIPVGQHFVVYDEIDRRVVVLTVLHQVRDVERIVAAMAPDFLAEIETIRGPGGGGEP